MRWLWVVLLTGCSSVSPEQLAEIDRLFAAADATDAEGDRAFQTAAAGATSVRPGNEPCGVRFSEGNTARFVERFVRWVALTRMGDRPPSSVVQAEYVTIADGALDKLGSAARAVRRDEETRLRARELDEYRRLDGKKLIARARELVERPLPPELLIVIEHAQEARPIDGARFAGGSVAARAWLYSDGKFVCAGEVDAASSPSVQVWYGRGGPRDDALFLSGDLYLNLIREAKKSLRAIAPEARGSVPPAGP